MLVLTRRIGEEIVIGENIRVKVVAVKEHRVGLGIIAPLSVVVRREELLIQSPKPTVAPIIRPCRKRRPRQGLLPDPQGIVRPAISKETLPTLHPRWRQKTMR